MLILEAGNIEKSYGDRLVFKFNEFKVFSGDHIGIVGDNGAGKTTFLNTMSKKIIPDEGYVNQFCDISYIEQLACSDERADGRISKEFGVSHVNNKNMSGGEKTRLKLANSFSYQNLLLFLDEPTANLDYKGIEILREKLLETETFLLISHDRGLLDSVCNKILEIKNQSIKMYIGNYTSYKQQLEVENKTRYIEYEKFILERERLESAIENRIIKEKSIRKAPKRMGNSEARLHRREATEKQGKISKTKNNLKTRIEKLEKKEKPEEAPVIKMDFSLTTPPKNNIVIACENLSFSYGSRTVFSNTNFNVINGKKTAIWGENGSGKTTLLNIISRNNDKSIRVVPKAKIGYFYQNLENLETSKSIIENVMDDSIQTQSVARTILARLNFKGQDVYKKVGVLSGGERVKVSFAKLFVSDANVLLLDEPTNFLDTTSMEALQEVLGIYEGTVLFVSHDTAFVNAIAEKLLIIENMGIREFNGTLNDFIASQNNL